MTQTLPSGRPIAESNAIPVVIMGNFTTDQEVYDQYDGGESSGNGELSGEPVAPHIMGYGYTVVGNSTQPVIFDPPVDFVSAGTVGGHPLKLRNIVTIPPATGNCEMWLMDVATTLLKFGKGVQIVSFEVANLDSGGVDVRFNGIRLGHG
jgi:hypothetical protein